MWGDEGFVAVNFPLRDFAGLVEPLEHGQIAPLGYLWTVEATSRILGNSEWALRLPAFLAGIASLALIFLLARSLLKPRCALLAIAIFAASYYPARHAGEVKPYSIDLFMSLAILLSAWHTMQSPRSVARWALLAVVATVGVWFSYPSVFVSGGAIAVVGFISIRSSRDARTWIIPAIVGIALAASFLAMYMLHARAQEVDAAWLKELGSWQHSFPPPITQPSRLLYWIADIHTGNFVAYPNGGNDFGSTVTTLLILAGAIWLWRRDRKWIVLLLLSPLVLNLIAAALHKYPYGESARVAQHMAPAFCLLAGTGLAAVLSRLLSPRRAVVGSRIAALVLTMVPISAIAIDLVQPYKKFSDRQNRFAVSEIAGRSTPSDRWVVFGTYEDSPYGPNMVAWGGSAARFRYNMLLRSPTAVLWSVPPLTVSPPAEEASVWLFKYQDNKAAFPDDAWTAYYSAIRTRLGEPVETLTYDHEERQELLTVYRFGPDG